MKIYERPSVEIKRFDVEDIMTESGEYSASNELFQEITGSSAAGVVFEW